MERDLFHYKKVYFWSLIAMLIGLVAFKFEALFLPFFWDEAWVYMPAIRTMAEQGLSIMPGSIDAELYTGHPLLFYFLAATWIKVFGNSLWVAHSFPLLISIGLLLSVYYVGYKWTKSVFAGTVSAFLVLVQPIFLTQSTFLLIECWLGLLFVWSFYFYFSRNWLGFAVVLVMALWSKESAYCLLPCFGLVAIFEYFILKDSAKVLGLKLAGILGLFLLGFVFFFIQKMKMGWYFFPRHSNWINFDEMNYKFDIAIDILFKNQGKSYFYILAFAALFIGIFKYDYRLKKIQYLQVGGILIFAFGFSLFASINFFSNRYLFGAIPLLMLGCGVFFAAIDKSFLTKIMLPLLVVLAAPNILTSLELKEFSDTELSYTKLLKAQVNMVDYLVSNPPQEQTYAPFLMLVNLSNSKSGFVKEGMRHLCSQVKDTSNVYYLSLPNEHENDFDSILATGKLELVYRAEFDQAWVDLHKKK
jgi:hypothetical protein